MPKRKGDNFLHDENEETIESDKLFDLLPDDYEPTEIDESATEPVFEPGDMEEEPPFQDTAAMKDELKQELIYLGMHEGDVVECQGVEGDGSLAERECRGVVTKRIKQGLVMEYMFLTPEGGIKDFHLNNVRLDLNEIPIEKLIKLIIVIRFINSKHRLEDEESDEKKKDKETKAELENRLEEEKREKQKRLVLGKL
jgi:hypothetical protein